jgi:parallel beta-helix repeat protein
VKLRRFAILSSVFVCFSTVAPAFAATLVVDNDFADCPQADFNSIQAAVLDARPGDKILVCRGVYLETVEVNKDDLRIEAQAAPGEVVLQAPAVVPPFGFHLLNTTGVLVQGFTVQRFGEANIRIEGGGGNTLRKNITQLSPNGHGIQVINSSGNVVEQNSSSKNLGAGIRGAGITVISTVTVPATSNNIIRHNETFENATVGLQILTSPPIVGALSGNVLFGNDSYDNRAIANVQLIGIRNVQLANGSVIENNRVFGNVRGIFVGNSTGVTVRNNRSARNKEFGIRLQNSAANNLVEKNEVFENEQDGIRLEGAAPPIPPGVPGPVVGNTVQLNVARRNGRDGIRVVDSLAAENFIERNVLLENVEHDAHDDSVGAHTGGTANYWINNRCGTEEHPGQNENRSGLCENH